MSIYDSEIDREKILNASLSTVQIQVEIIESLLRANKRLQEGLSAATREIKRLTDKAQTSRNSGIV